jgi:hypothetical protein
MRAPISPEEVAERTAFLASRADRLTAGQLIQIDECAYLGRDLPMIPEPQPNSGI